MSKRTSKKLPDLPASAVGDAGSVATRSTGASEAAVVAREEGVWVSLSKQAKFIVFGAVPVWYLDVTGSLIYVVQHGSEDWTRTLGLVTLVFLASTVVLLAYLVLLPTRGITPDWARWNRDEHLRSLIPALTISIVGGYITLLLLLSPLCEPKLGPASVLPSALAARIGAAAESAGGNVQAASARLQALSSRAASSLFSSLHQPLVPVRSGNWFSGGKSASSSSGGIDTKRLLAALKLPDARSLGAQLGIPAKRIDDFSKSLDRGLQSVTLSSLQASLANAASEAGSGAPAWMKRGAWGWLRAAAGAGAMYLAIFGIVGLLGVFGSTQKAAQRRRELKAKQSL